MQKISQNLLIRREGQVEVILRVVSTNVEKKGRFYESPKVGDISDVVMNEAKNPNIEPKKVDNLLVQ